ncbi:MAG: hypothetical protein ACQSGP_13065 [Frankia sp.]
MYVVRITPADVGRRVSVRHRITGPVSLTDVVGELVDWSAGTLAIRTAAGRVVTVAETDLVAGKTVPARAVRGSRRGQADP